MKTLRLILIVSLLTLALQTSFAQHTHNAGDPDVELHINPRWRECSFQLDPSLTQTAWRQFTREGGLVAYFRPLTDAKPMGAGKFEVSILKWATAIDETQEAWNNTFVHPDAEHWLVGGPRLSFPGITVRAGLTKKLDAGVYFTKSPGANYGFVGGQLQYNVLNNEEKKWSASARANFTSMYGPEDLKLTISGIDLVASREIPVYRKWASIAPYVGISSYLSHAHETTNAVDLKDENVIGAQAMIGAVAKISFARLSVEYNLAKVNSISMKIGVSF